MPTNFHLCLNYVKFMKPMLLIIGISTFIFLWGENEIKYSNTAILTKKDGNSDTKLLASWQYCGQELIHQWGPQSTRGICQVVSVYYTREFVNCAKLEHIKVKDHLCRSKNLANNEIRVTSNKEMSECTDL